MLCSYLYYTTFYRLIQLLFCPSSITCVNSMDASYIPIAEARGFTTHWIRNLPIHFIISRNLQPAKIKAFRSLFLYEETIRQEILVFAKVLKCSYSGFLNYLALLYPLKKLADIPFENMISYPLSRFQVKNSI